MVRLLTIVQFLPLLLPYTVLAKPTPAPAPADFNLDIPLPEFDLINWWRKNIFICPLWKGPLPAGFSSIQSSICYNSETKTYTRGPITTRLYQIPGEWQKDTRYKEIVNGAGSAIAKGLVKLSPLIPTGSNLTINVGITSGGLGERVQIDSDNNGQSTPCYILLIYPPYYNPVPLLAFQKDLIMRMYQCVEQFHRPTVTKFTEANTWWRLGIARYFDGLSYPTVSGTGASDFLQKGLYPEEYSWGMSLYANYEAAALFFHWADQHGGWSPADVNNWMKGHADKKLYEDERTSLSADTKITSGVWHRFVLAAMDQTIQYPTGQKIVAVNGGPPKKIHNEVISIVNVGGTYTKLVTAESFKGSSEVFTFKAGQSFSLTVERLPGVEWSIRKVGSGSSGWNIGNPGRSVSLVVPAGGADGKWEMAFSSTGARIWEHPRLTVTRTA